MIQRKQTLYLLLSILLLSVVFFFPLSESYDTLGNPYIQNYLKVFRANDGAFVFRSLTVVILLVLTVALAFISVFLYTNRRLQMRFCIFNIILMLGLTGLIYFYYKAIPGEISRNLNLEISTQRMFLSVLSPVLASFFGYLAFKAILRDELLVKASDRLR